MILTGSGRRHFSSVRPVQFFHPAGEDSFDNAVCFCHYKDARHAESCLQGVQKLLRDSLFLLCRFPSIVRLLFKLDLISNRFTG